MLRLPDGSRRLTPWILVGSAALVALALALAVPSARPAAFVFVAAIVLTGPVAGPNRIPALAGFMVPVAVVDHVPSNVLLVILVGLLAASCLVAPPSVSRSGRDLVVVLVVLVGVIAAVQRIELAVEGSVIPAVRSTLMLVGGCSVAGLVAIRTGLRDHLLRGYLAGVAVSSIVGLAQLAEIATPRAFDQLNRGPGLAQFTTVQSFACAVAVVVAVYLYIVAPSTTERWSVAALGVLCAVGLAINGAQGGLYAVALTLAGVLVFARSKLRLRGIARTVALGGALAVIVVMVPVAFGVGLPSVRGLGGDPTTGYENENARLTAAKAGVHELLDHPLTGPGTDRFLAAHGPAMPHFLPLKVGVSSGVGGFLLALGLVGTLVALVVRGPVGRRSPAWMGFAVLVVLLARTLSTPDGPFGDIASMVVFLVAAVAASGEPPRRQPGDEPSEEPTAAATSDTAPHRLA